jgi:hypothetical protein
MKLEMMRKLVDRDNFSALKASRWEEANVKGTWRINTKE